MKKTRERMRQELEQKASIEEIVLALREEMGLAFVAQVLEGQEKTAPVREHCKGCGQEMRHKGKKRKVIESRIGEILLEREYCYCAECSAGLFPPGSTVEGRGDAQE